MHEKQSRMSPFFKQCVVAAGVSLNNLAHGGGLAFPAALLPQLRARGELTLGAGQESWIASVSSAAMAAGCLLTVPAMRRGRRRTHHLVSLLHLAGWLAIAFAPSYEVLMIGRCLQGASNGLLLSVIGVILGEYSSPAHRGTLLGASALAQAAGVLAAHAAGAVLAWRRAALLLAFFPLAGFLVTLATPESPSWLALQGRYDECRQAFRWLRGPDEEDELEELIRTRQHADRQPKTGSTFRETIRAFSKRDLYIPQILGILMYLLLSAGGSTIVASYMPEVLQELVAPDCNVHVWMGICDGVRLVTNAIMLYVVKRLPRRTMLISMGVACVGAFLAQVGYVCAKNSGLIRASLWLPAVLLVWHISTIGLGMVTLPYIIVGEIYPLQYRSVCSCIGNLALAGFVFVILKTFPAMMSALGLAGTYALYAGCMAAALAAVAALLPETRGRTLQQVEDSFRGTPAPLARAREIEPLSRSMDLEK